MENCNVTFKVEFIKTKKAWFLILYSLITMSIKGQSWVKQKTVFHYKGYYEVWNNEGIIIKKQRIRDFTIRIDSLLRGKNCVFIFLSNYFDIGISNSKKHDFYGNDTKACLAIYNKSLYQLFYDSSIVLRKNIDFEDILTYKYKDLNYDKKLNLTPDKKDSSEYKTNRFLNSLNINQQEKEAFFVKKYWQDGKFADSVNLYKIVDDIGYYNDSLIYSNRYFFTAFHKNLIRSPNPYHIQLQLQKIDFNFRKIKDVNYLKRKKQNKIR